jgi:hypothetical protein
VYLAQVVLYSLQFWYLFCNMSLIKLPRIIFLLIWHTLSSVTISSFFVPFSNHVSLSSQSSSVSISSHILPCFCVTAFLTGSYPDISIVWEFSFTSVFRIVCQILSSSILRTIPYHVTVLFFSYSKVFALKILFCVVFCVLQLYYTHKRLLSATVNVCTNICLRYVHISIPYIHMNT